MSLRDSEFNENTSVPTKTGTLPSAIIDACAEKGLKLASSLAKQHSTAPNSTSWSRTRSDAAGSSAQYRSTTASPERFQLEYHRQRQTRNASVMILRPLRLDGTIRSRASSSTPPDNSLWLAPAASGRTPISERFNDYAYRSRPTAQRRTSAPKSATKRENRQEKIRDNELKRIPYSRHCWRKRSRKC